jgi:pyruvate, water dikinase
MKYVKTFSEIRINHLEDVGGKNASLGQMMYDLKKESVHIPDGFATTSQAYWHFIDHNNLRDRITHYMDAITNIDDTKKITAASTHIRTLIESKPVPDDLKKEIIHAYTNLCATKSCPVAVRSSATAEDLPTASFAGQQETFLNVRGQHALVQAWRTCVSSLFTPRAIMYRIVQKFDYQQVALSVGVQQMIDAKSAGVVFTLDTESGFRDVVFITSAYGLGETVVQGTTEPDEFYVHKQNLQQGFKPLLSKRLGAKKVAAYYARKGIKSVRVPIKKRATFSLSDEEVLELARQSLAIEHLYTQKNKKWTPMDIEWVKDNDNVLYIVQARPETVHVHAYEAAQKTGTSLTTFALNKNTTHPTILAKGQSIGQQITTGIVRVILSVKDSYQVQTGDILITTMTDPDWVPIMKKAAAIITDQGSRMCHAAIISRELGIPAIVGTHDATKKIKTGAKVTIDCSQGETGYIYDGELAFTKKTINIKKLPKPPVPVLLNIGQPNQAFMNSFLPVDGVGLARLEFIIANNIQIHPLALLHPRNIKEKKIRHMIDERIAAYPTPVDYFVDILSQDVATIAAAFWPRPVIVRLSDFKSNEYRNLIGGKYFEPQEENPMLGLRGASRYYSELYKEAFTLECNALKKARDIKGFKNIKLMLPFVRTPKEALTCLTIMKKNGLVRKKDDLDIIMMCEIPSNVIMIDEFSAHFDGFSIGSNDLTQLTLGIDRDDATLAQLFDERDESVKRMITLAIKGAHKNKRTIGICGQAPSDFPEFGAWLIQQHIDSISLNPDAVIPFIQSQKTSR